MCTTLRSLSAFTSVIDDRGHKFRLSDSKTGRSARGNHTQLLLRKFGAVKMPRNNTLKMSPFCRTDHKPPEYEAFSFCPAGYYGHAYGYPHGHGAVYPYDDGKYHPGKLYDDGKYHPGKYYDDGKYYPGKYEKVAAALYKPYAAYYNGPYGYNPYAYYPQHYHNRLHLPSTYPYVY